MNRNQTIFVSVAFAACATTLLAWTRVQQTPSTPQQPAAVPPPRGASRFASPAELERINRLNELSKSAAEAEERKDYEGAEQDLKTWIAVNFNNPVDYGTLAHFYDRRGRDHDAYLAWEKMLYADPKLGSSSEQEDPVVLTHFGELATKFGRPDQARVAYQRASEKAIELTWARMQSVSTSAVADEMGEVAKLSAKIEMAQLWASSPGVKTLKARHLDRAEAAKAAEQMSFANLRSAALYTSALTSDGEGERVPALAQMREAVSSQPKWSLAHLGMAWILRSNGQSKESAAEYQRAEALAGPEVKAFIHKERVRQGLAVTGP